MKLLLFSDIHCDLQQCRRLVERSRSVDIVIGAGDFGNIRSGLQRTIDVLSDITCPTVVVPGNSESLEELQEACRNWPAAIVLHGNGTRLQELDFYGIGGGIPITPFGSWSYDFDEGAARELLAGLPEEAILVSHSPPKGAVDRSSMGSSLGSTAVRDAILEKQPRLVVCGHIHGSAGQQEMLGESLVINAGPQGLIEEV